MYIPTLVTAEISVRDEDSIVMFVLGSLGLSRVQSDMNMGYHFNLTILTYITKYWISHKRFSRSSNRGRFVV